MTSDMFKVSTFNVDKFAHKFIQNLGLRIEPCACNKFSKITFLTHVDRYCKIKQLLLYSAEKMKEINMEQHLDFSNEKSVKYFMDKYVGAFDKLKYSNNTRILTSHLNNINTKILQKVRLRKKNYENNKQAQVKVHKTSKNGACNKKMRANLSNKLVGQKKDPSSHTTYKGRHVNFNSNKSNRFKKVVAFGNSDVLYHGTIASDCQRDNSVSNKDNNKQKIFDKCNLASRTMSISKKELETTAKFIQLYIKDDGYLKRSVQVTLHIPKKSKDISNGRMQIKYNQMLCRHAILCLIEPSEQAFVLLEDDLPIVIQKYLSHGYKYHFKFQRHSRDYYTALLILSSWAKVLVKNMNTTMMRTICGILECDAQKVLVLCSPEEKLY